MYNRFNIEVAKKYGVEAAVVFNYFCWEVYKSKCGKRDFYDGLYWTRESNNELKEQFPYLTERQINYAIKKLVDAGVLVKSNYNVSPYDRTLWYSVVGDVEALIEN